MKKHIGAHTSASGGVYNAIINADAINAKAFAFFLKNQKTWQAKPYSEEVILKFKENMKKYGYKNDYVLPHAGYLINLGNPDREKNQKSFDALCDELDRANQLGLNFLNIHPGSSLKIISESQCIELIAQNINLAIKKIPNIVIVIENTAGQGGNVGYRFEHLRDIIDKIENKNRIGICLDTCHTYAAGYDLQNKYDEIFKEFEDLVGIEFLKGIHLNNSMVECGSRKDRHQNIKYGKIGIDFFEKFANDERFDNMPIILETTDSSLWTSEIELLYELIKK